MKNLVKDENHSLQTHVVNMEYFEKSAIIRLEQMGLKVERTYVKKNKKIMNEIDCKDEDDCKENEDDFNVICMYELEKLTSDAVALNDAEVNITSTSTTDADLIVPETSKALLSFDEILDGIVKCNKKNITVDLQTSKELEETEDRQH